MVDSSQDKPAASEIIGPLRTRDRLTALEQSGFQPSRTAQPLDGERKSPIDTNFPKGHGPQGEYDIDSDNKNRSSVPRNPKDSRPDQK